MNKPFKTIIRHAHYIYHNIYYMRKHRYVKYMSWVIGICGNDSTVIISLIFSTFQKLKKKIILYIIFKQFYTFGFTFYTISNAQ